MKTFREVISLRSFLLDESVSDPEDLERNSVAYLDVERGLNQALPLPKRGSDNDGRIKHGSTFR
jgi:hypothetical protein